MPRLPDEIVNKPAQFLQRVVAGIGVIFAIGAIANVADHDMGGAVVGGVLAAVALIVAANIKTKYRFKGGGGIYR